MRKRSSTKQQPDPTFFADRNLGKEFVRLLRAAGFKVESHHDLYPENDTEKEETDAHWIAEVSRRHWVILTGDKAIGSDELEIDALMHGGGRGFCRPPKMRPADFADLIIRSRVQLFRYIAKKRKQRAGPYLARLRPDPKHPGTKPGHISKWIDEAEWRRRKKKWAKGRK